MNVNAFKSTTNTRKYIKSIFHLFEENVRDEYVEFLFTKNTEYIVRIVRESENLCTAMFCFDEKRYKKYLYLDFICSARGFGGCMIKYLYNLCIYKGLLGIALDSVEASANFFKKYGFLDEINMKNVCFEHVFSDCKEDQDSDYDSEFELAQDRKNSRFMIVHVMSSELLQEIGPVVADVSTYIIS